MVFGLTKGLRRQLDAHDIDVDTFAGYVKFKVYPPSELHLERVPKLVRGSGFTPRRVEVTLFGDVSDDGYVIQLRGTGQEIELDEVADEDDSAHFVTILKEE